jgi:exodeoxyribonuclease-1
LTSEERQRWYGFCQQRLSDPQWGAPNTLGDFEQARKQGRGPTRRRGVLEAWQVHARQLQAQFQFERW